MLTGDSEAAANAIAEETGIDEVYSKLLPDEKLLKLQEQRTKHGAVMFVGDGINDAPVLAGADCGVAVSYTHLDVYKRQTEGCAKLWTYRIQCKIMEDRKGQWKTGIKESVQYIHIYVNTNSVSCWNKKSRKNRREKRQER